MARSSDNGHTSELLTVTCLASAAPREADINHSQEDTIGEGADFESSIPRQIDPRLFNAVCDRAHLYVGRVFLEFLPSSYES